MKPALAKRAAGLDIEPVRAGVLRAQSRQFPNRNRTCLGLVTYEGRTFNHDVVFT